MVCSDQNVTHYYLKVFDQIVVEVVVRGLCSVFQQLIKVTFKRLSLVIAIQTTKFFLLFTKNL